MAFSSSKLVLNAISRAVTNGRQLSSFKSSSRYLLNSSQECQTPRTLSRSLWNLCTGSRRNSTGNRGDDMHGPLASGTTRVSWPSNTCSCGCKGACLHMEADSDLVNFLKEEIEVEQGSLTGVPKIPGFEATINDADIQLTRDVEGERITVRFNVNHSVEMEGGAQEGQEDATPEMRSYPDFNVEISKGGANSLRISCAYQRDDVLGDQDVSATAADDEDDELFLIDEVLFAKEGASMDSLEGAYRVGSEVMNGDLYDHLKNYLAERGITNDFCEKLSDLASAVEHRQYIGFLDQLQSFVKK